MKKTISGFVITAVLGLAGSLAVAQEQGAANAQQPSTSDQSNSAPARHGRRAMDPNMQAQHMAKKLKLTPDQQSQVVSVLSAQIEQVTSLRSDTSLSREDRHSKMQALRSDSEAKIRAILTDDQKQTFDQMQEQHRNRQHTTKG